ncbi:hypothetical protein QR680_002824 [Steinernema hermaphroditum]|uniref:PAX-interacting protein 1 n=1 Tax=Steinernema hermaphroditum TaxID=289476 RepID=A0AA39LJ14_9BILA|nr:hypothetical protein QR680_002824 [Steinernema hermaphroditum]
MEGAVDGMSVHRTEDEPMSPLEPLDPHRLREMVVDQHNMTAGGHLQRMQSMQCFQWSPSAIPALIQAAGQSPLRGHSRESNNSGSPAAQRRRLSSGSDSHSMQQLPQLSQPSSNFNDQQRTPMNFNQNNEINSPNARSVPMSIPQQTSQHSAIGMLPGQNPLGSPPSVQSPFNRNTPGPSITPSSPFPLSSNHFPGQSPSSAGLHGMGAIGQPQPPQTPQNHVNPANQVNMSPSQNQSLYSNAQAPRNVPYPASNQPTSAAQSQHTSYPFPTNAGQVPGSQAPQLPPQQQQQWMSPQQMQQHFAGQPRMFGNPGGQRVVVQRVPYPQGYNTAMTQAQPGYPRPTRLPYPPGNPSAPASQQQGGQSSQTPSQQTPPSAVTSPPVAYPPALQAKEQQTQQQQQQAHQQQQQHINGFVVPPPQAISQPTPQAPIGFPTALPNFPPPPGAQVPPQAMTPRTPLTPQVRPPLMNAVPQPPQQHITSPHSNVVEMQGDWQHFVVLHVIFECPCRSSLAMGEDPIGIASDGHLVGFASVTVAQKPRVSELHDDKENFKKVLKEVAPAAEPPTQQAQVVEKECNSVETADSESAFDPDDFEEALESVEIDEAATEFEHESYDFINENVKSQSSHSNCAVPQLSEENSGTRPAKNDDATIAEMDVDPVDSTNDEVTSSGQPPASQSSEPNAKLESSANDNAQTVPAPLEIHLKRSVSPDPEPIDLSVKKRKSEASDESDEEASTNGDSEAASSPDGEDASSPSLSAIKLYPSGSVTPSQAPPFTVRFGPPVQGVSPQYPNASDLRSPGLMSPTQALRPQCLPGEPLVPNIMRVATQGSHFFGHDLQHFSMPLDMCLMGCNFFLVENERSLNDKHDLANLSAVIKYHGGDLKWGNQGYSERTTHVLCESYQHPFVRNENCRKRCVTLQWLNEVLMRKRMEAPWKYCHLPSFWNDVKRPPSGTGKAIAVCGWTDIELINVKMMISAIGARFTPHLSCENDYIIARCESEKVEKARDWGVKVLNYRWLLDAYTGICNGYPDPENPHYGLGTSEPCPEVSTTPYVMERHSDIYNKLLAPWKIPILVNQELFNIGMELRKSIENDENIFPFKKVKSLSPPPSDEQIAQAQKLLRDLGQTLPKCVIYFSGMLPEDEKNLAKKAEFLGAEITMDVEKCTHFVCVSLFRTVELMKAIALGKNVVSHNFIVYGYTILHFPDTYDLYLRDDENEKNYGYNVKTSVFRARRELIFEDCIFHVMPSVHPSHKILCELIRIAGGIVEDERPSPQYLADCIEYERPYFVIGCDADLHLYHYLMDCRFPIYNEEFVMIAILRQEFDTSPNYLVNNNVIPPATSTPSTPIQPRLPPAVIMNGTATPLQNVPQPTAPQRVKAQ